MKIAEALLQRSDLQRRVQELEKRLRDSARVQEGDDPPEDPRELVAELRSVLVALRVLQIAINRSNGRHHLSDGRTLMEALVQRDIVRLELKALRALLEEANPLGPHRSYRLTRSEVRFVPTVDLGSLHREVDEKQRDLRELNVQIQTINWAADLSEI